MASLLRHIWIMCLSDGLSLVNLVNYDIVRMHEAYASLATYDFYDCRRKLLGLRLLWSEVDMAGNSH